MGLISELKRRNVFRMMVLYAVAAWLIMQVAEVIVTLGALPAWTGQVMLVVLAIGFPIALVFSWFYELTSEGLSLEKDVERHESITHITGRRMDFIVIALLGAVVVVFAFDKFVLDPSRDAAEINAAVQIAHDRAIGSREFASSIVVLPFVNLGGDSSDEYLSDGITEEVLNSLSTIDNLRVVGRTSSFSFKGKNTDIRTIGAALGVSNVLEGSIRKSDDRLRIAVQLVSAADGFQIWSHSYDREMADIFNVQRDIARQIAGALRVELDLTAAHSMARRGTESLDAYTWYLRGHHLLLQDDPANSRIAVEAFNNAIRLDDRYARAYAWLALANIGLLSWGVASADDPLRRAEEALEVGLELDPHFSETRLALALLRAYKNDWSGAEEEFQKALELNPENPFAQRQWAYLLYAILGRPHDAVELSEKYLEREPLDLTAVGTKAMSLAQLGQISIAESELQRIIAIDPEYPFSYYRLATLHAFFKNQRTESLRWYRKSLEMEPGSIQTPLDAARVLLDLGDPDSADMWARAAERNSTESPLGDFANYFVARYRADDELAERISQRLAHTIDRVPEGYQYLMDFAWLRSLHRKNFDLAKRVYLRLYPELVSENPTVNAWNHAAAISLADLMLCCGDESVATDLLDKSLSVLMATTDQFHDPAECAVFSLTGDLGQSIESLKRAVHSGWRREWWLLERDRIFEPLWATTEFRDLIAEIEVDISLQLRQLRETEQNLNPIRSPKHDDVSFR